MARTTRSTAQHDKDDTPVTPPSPSRNKKRKRASNTQSVDEPAAKQPRPDPEVKQEDDSRDHPVAGDVPLEAMDTERILTVLEMIDTQGLLDRIFPLPADASPSTSTATERSYSFRALLKESSVHPLRVLRSAVQQLFPISSHPRSKPSTPAAQQLRFCELALSLLDQASFHSPPVPLDFETILPPHQEPSLFSTHSVKRRKHALMQKLPSGTWWSSLNSDCSSLAPPDQDLKDLPTGHAELAAIIPSPSNPSPSTKPPPTLGDFYIGKKAFEKGKLPGPRHVNCGSFLDYGPYSSFAPTFEQDGVEIGRSAVGMTLWERERKKRSKEQARFIKERLQTTVRSKGKAEIGDESHTVHQSTEEDGEGNVTLPTHELLKTLLPAEHVSTVEFALADLELEGGIRELLVRNAKALVRLKELQLTRLDKQIATVAVGSEEWNIAQGIAASLALLASLRPRSSASDESSPLIPPPAVLRTLHRTLPLSPSPGWFGTLPEAHTTALRDDTTLHIRSGAVAPPAPAPATAPAPAPAPTASITNTTPTSFQGYNYSGYAGGQYRAGYYPTAGQGQTSGYYPNVYPQQSAGMPSTPAQGQAAGSSHYGYSYTPWYANYQPQTTSSTATPANSGRGTPQPGSSVPSYGYFTSAAQQQQPPLPQRTPVAVANTVSGSKPQQNGWAPGYAAPTLPPHLRGVATGAAGPSTPTSFQSHYYGAYHHPNQPTPPAR